MRKAFQHVKVYCEDGNALLSFGFDYCAEHEWGIRGIQRCFGVSADVEDLTVQRYAVTQIEQGRLHLFEANTRGRVGHARLFLVGGRTYLNTEEAIAGCRESCPNPDEPEALWDENGFMFSIPVGFGREKTFRAVYKALQDMDALIYTSGMGGVFGGRGLVVARRSTIPRECIKEMEDDFTDKKRLREASDATGIVARVDAWGRSKNRLGGAFFALSPAWLKKGFTTENGPRKSAHPVIYWLNPYDQRNNNFGWFTVEELEEWMDGNGPIPKREKVSA